MPPINLENYVDLIRYFHLVEKLPFKEAIKKAQELIAKQKT